MEEVSAARRAERLEIGSWPDWAGVRCNWEVWHTKEVRWGLEEHEWLLMVGRTPDMRRACAAVLRDGKVFVTLASQRIPGEALRAFIEAAMEGCKQ